MPRGARGVAAVGHQRPARRAMRYQLDEGIRSGASRCILRSSGSMRMRPAEALLLACYVALIVACVLLPYVFGLRPRQRRDWNYITATLTFLTWLLAGFVFLRSI